MGWYLYTGGIVFTAGDIIVYGFPTSNEILYSIVLYFHPKNSSHLTYEQLSGWPNRTSAKFYAVSVTTTQQFFVRMFSSLLKWFLGMRLLGCRQRNPRGCQLSSDVFGYRATAVHAYACQHSEPCSDIQRCRFSRITAKDTPQNIYFYCQKIYL